MDNQLGSLEGIVDIEPPLKPMLYNLELSALNIAFPVLIGMLVIFSMVIFVHFFSTRRKPHSQLRKIQKDFLAKKITTRKAAFQLTEMLRNSLRLSPILTHSIIPEELGQHRLRWDTFTKQLSSACYSSSDIEPETTSLLFEEAHFWLKAWPRYKKG